MKKVFSYIEQYQMIKPDDRVIVGLSGGADSVGLLLLLKEYQTECQKKSPEKNSFLLEAVHVKHLQKTCVSHLVFSVPVIPIRF